MATEAGFPESERAARAAGGSESLIGDIRNENVAHPDVGRRKPHGICGRLSRCGERAARAAGGSES